MGKAQARTTDRLAVVIMATANGDTVLGPLGRQLDEARAADLLQARLLDTIAGMIRLNGVNLAVAVDPAERADLSRLVPSGFDVLTTTAPVSSKAAAAWALWTLLDRRFDRVVAVLPGSVPLPARIVATALAVAANVDLTLGATPSGRLYLAGARDHRSAVILEDARASTVAEVRDAAERSGLTVGLAEPRRLLDDFSDLGALRAYVEGNADVCPEMWHWFSSEAVPKPLH